MKRLLIISMILCLWGMGANAQTDNCDVNGDGVVNIVDVTYVLDHILGKGHASTPTEEPGEAVDLGLPSGTKWASCNMGANKPEEYGGYYAWGETEEKEVYNESTYKYYQNGSYVNIGSDISGTDYDVAHVKWGGNWCMPTLDDIKELFDNCTNEWTTLNGVNGSRFTSRINGNSIFLPAAGYRDGDCNYASEHGDYWSSTQYPDYSFFAYYFDFGQAAYWGSYADRNYGRSVRPVEKPKANDVPAEAVDLGLPSGTKWANCNVGATKPEEYGGYYAWGETEEKDYYYWSTYIHCDGSYSTCHDLGSDISGTEYDVAHVKWGGKWCMPTLDDIKELLDNCTNEWTTLNGVNGSRFTSKINGNSIFLPAAGYRWYGDLNFAGEYGYYWSSTQNPDNSSNAYGLDFGSGIAYWSYYRRGNGRSVRPVARN